jgi:hypothetical protein
VKTLCNLLEYESCLPSLEDLGYELVDDIKSEPTVILCGLEHVEQVSSLVNPQECLLVVALYDKEEERHLVPAAFDIWIDRSRLSRLPVMLETFKSHIDQKITIRTQRETIERLCVDTTTHRSNLEGIKLNMRDSTDEIKTIFKDRVEEMQAIHRDTGIAHEKLTQLRGEIVSEEFDNLEESWNMTRAILSRTDEVIKAMFQFVVVLQCEDRITQMVDGIEKIMDDDLAYAATNGCVISPDKQALLRARLAPFYTIQDQRDFANGQENAMQGCKVENVNIDEFLLF